ncbi:MAG: terminase TerL endonuclease subunit [Nitrospiraceae bacterium]
MARAKTAESIVHRYVERVECGKITAGPGERAAVARYIADMRKGKSRGLRFDSQQAEDAIAFFGYLKHSKGEWAGQKMELADWQQFIVWNLFGWYRDDGTRRFRKAYNEFARKNGKSTLAAGIGLKLAFADNEAGAEVYAAATKKDQARIVWSEAKRMVKASSDLEQYIRVWKDNLSRESTNQKFEPLGSDEDTLDGLNPHGAIVDELHAHKTRGVWDVLETALGARRHPLLFAITTAGVDLTSICWEMHHYSHSVLTGAVQDDSWFAVIASLDEHDNWEDERVWRKANPNLGISKKLTYMRELARKAKHLPASLNAFLRLDLNRWTQQVERWIDMDLWNSNAGHPIQEEQLHGRVAFGGLDLSSVADITAWVMIFPDEDDPQRITVLPRFWVPEAKLIDPENRYKDHYQAWHRAGYLIATPGNAIEYAMIKAQILRDAETFCIQSLNIDRLFQGYQLAMELADEGLTVTGMGMGFMSMAGPTSELERRLLDRKVHHGGNPVLRWMANNVSAKMDPAGNKKPDKSTSQGKIDGIVALLLALDRAMRGGEEGSVYDKREMVML